MEKKFISLMILCGTQINYSRCMFINGELVDCTQRYDVDKLEVTRQLRKLEKRLNRCATLHTNMFDPHLCRKEISGWL